MSVTLGQRIHVRGDFQYDEHIANAALSPGHLIEVLSTGKVQKHATAGGRCERRVAIEDANQGASPFVSGGRTVNTAYAADDLIPNHTYERGSIANLFLKAGTTYAIGDKLVSAGDGTLEKESALASAGLEKDCIAVIPVDSGALNLSGSGAVATLHAVQFI